MRPRVLYYAALSLAREDPPAQEHDLGFLETLQGGPEGDYEQFLAGVDSLVMGAETWRFMVAHGSWPYEQTPSWVLTHAEQLEDLPGAEAVERFSGDVRELAQLIGERGLSRTWLVGGGHLAGQLLAADLLDELILTVAPTFVGRGRRWRTAGFRCGASGSFSSSATAATAFGFGTSERASRSARTGP